MDWRRKLSLARANVHRILVVVIGWRWVVQTPAVVQTEAGFALDIAWTYINKLKNVSEFESSILLLDETIFLAAPDKADAFNAGRGMCAEAAAAKKTRMNANLILACRQNAMNAFTIPKDRKEDKKWGEPARNWLFWEKSMITKYQNQKIETQYSYLIG